MLLFFTASWCGPCRMVKGVTFRNAEVAALLGRIDLRVLDIDTPAGKVYQRAYGSERRSVPELVLFDRTGIKIASLEGYNKDPQRTIEFLGQAFPKEEPTAAAEVPAVKSRDADTLRVSLPPETRSEAFRGERPGFMLRLAHFSVDAEPRWRRSVFRRCFLRVRCDAYGILCFGDDLSGDKPPLGGGSRFRIRSHGRQKPFGGAAKLLSGASCGSAVSDSDTFRNQDVPFGGLYGACRVGYAAPDAVVPGRWDAGVRGRLIFEAGTFRLSAGYSRGLVHCLADRGYNQTFGVGVTICLGK